MRKSRLTDSQILSILKQAEAGTPVQEITDPAWFDFSSFRNGPDQCVHISLRHVFHAI